MSAKTVDRWRNKATKHQGRGHPPFIPTDEQRRFVAAMAGIRMTWEEIRQLVINPTTGEPITKTTLARAFKRELAEGKAKLKGLIATRYYEALGRGESWAIQLGLKTQFGWRPDGAGGFIMPPNPEGERRHMRIEFVLPSGEKGTFDDEPRPLPSPPPALPPLTIEAEANPPSSGVPVVPRRRNGWMA